MSSVSFHDAAVRHVHRVIPRMKSEDRRELILDAAMRVFGDFGYYGATTDQVAKAAGVSQPYVVRMFGTKEKLFLEVLERGVGHVRAAFEAVIAEGQHDIHHRLGHAYADLVSDRGILLTLMHAFVLGSDPTIGAVARAGFLDIYQLLREKAGFTAEEVNGFLAQGMLINTIVGLRMVEDIDSDPRANEMLMCAFPEKLEVLLDLGKAQQAEQERAR